MRPAATVVAAGALALAALSGCGGSTSGDDAPLAWKGTPTAYRPADLPNDRVVLATVRNRSSKPVRLEAAKLVVRDAGGHVLRSSGRFVTAYAHGLYGAFQKPDPLPPDELKRLGLVITLAPGRTSPLYVAWRLTRGSTEPVTVDYGKGRLTLPKAARPATR